MGGRHELGVEPLPPEAEAGCIFCGGPLYLISDAYPLAFLCARGHFLKLTDLLEGLLVSDDVPPAYSVRWWERMALHLHSSENLAVQQGHLVTAADFKEAARRIDDWVSLVSELPSNAAPSGRSEETPVHRGETILVTTPTPHGWKKSRSFI